MTRIFISYRRNDNAGTTGRIYDRLVNEFGNQDIFYDKKSIEIGERFPQRIEEAVKQCEILLTIIGPNWVGLSENGQIRVESAEDFVRKEIELALQNNKLIIPVLIHNASMPSKTTLPQSLHQLHEYNASTIGDDPYFDSHVQRLIDKLQEHLSYQVLEINSNWTACFFSTTNHTGTPIPVAGLKEINFNWGQGIPNVDGLAIPGISADNFSARFVAEIFFPQNRKYLFVITFKDHIKLIVDNDLVYDRTSSKLLTEPVPCKLTAGIHNVTVEYTHFTGEAEVSLVIR